jgi:uncharacterized protein Yka (UPF0111/DUF47 family)
MKKNRAALMCVCFLLLLTGTSWAQNNVVAITEPVKYNDYIVDQQTAIGEGILSFTNALNDEKNTQEGALNQLDLSLKITENALANIKNLKRLNPDFGLGDAAQALFEFYKKTMEISYKEMVIELFNTSPDMDKLNRIIQSVSDDEKMVDQTFSEAQEKFAQHYNISLGENELQKKLD